MWQETLRDILLLPRAAQHAALRAIVAGDGAITPEAWNTAFAPDSLYEAWGRLPHMQGLYAANRRLLRPLLDARPSWHIVEVGGGNGALWRDFFHPNERGMLTLIDPVPDAHRAVAAALPSGVVLDSVIAGVEGAEIPQADALICSLTLHHVPGIDAEQRQRFGLTGPGKAELLARFVCALQERRGTGILNEADIDNELHLAPGDAVLIDHFIDVYVRRCAMAILASLASPGVDAALKSRWEAIIRHWCIDQVERAMLPRPERDVYELDVARWLGVLERAGASVQSHAYTDPWHLFHQYVFMAME